MNWRALKTSGSVEVLCKRFRGSVNVRREERRRQTAMGECGEEEVGWTPMICRNEPAGPSSPRHVYCY
jgi:hypothetical protein